jgi:hypothetical protein
MGGKGRYFADGLAVFMVRLRIGQGPGQPLAK